MEKNEDTAYNALINTWRRLRISLKGKSFEVDSECKPFLDTKRMESSDIIKRNQGVLSTNIDGEAVLMSVDSGNYFTLNPIGSAIWDLLERPLSLAQLHEELLKKFEGDNDTILEESKAYIQDLATRGLVS